MPGPASTHPFYTQQEVGRLDRKSSKNRKRSPKCARCIRQQTFRRERIGRAYAKITRSTTIETTRRSLGAVGIRYANEVISRTTRLCDKLTGRSIWKPPGFTTFEVVTPFTDKVTGGRQ